MTQSKYKTMPRQSFLAAAIVVAATAGLVAPTIAQAVTLDYIGQQIVPTGTPYAGTTVGGLSALDFDRSNARYFAISDDRSGINPARFYTLSLDLNKFQRSGTPGMDGVNFSSATTILTSAGAAFAPNTLDPEGLRYDAARGLLLWSNEGQRSAGGLQNPTVREMKIDGSHLRDFAVPTIFNPAGTVAGNDAADRGVRNNLAFENLALSRDGRTLWTATENALVQDGPAAAVGVKSASRVLSFDVATGQPGAQYLYEVEAVALPPALPGLFATNGLTDFIEVGDRQFIAIERSFAVGAQTPGVGPNGLATGNTIRLYLADARQATNVSGLDSIAGQAVVPMQKSLLLDLSTLKNDDGTFLATDNIEGITFGPEFNGQRTLMLVSDNNFSGTQFTQFIALGITGAVPEPSTWAMFLFGLFGAAALARRRQA